MVTKDSKYVILVGILSLVVFIVFVSSTGNHSVKDGRGIIDNDGGVGPTANSGAMGEKIHADESLKAKLIPSDSAVHNDEQVKDLIGSRSGAPVGSTGSSNYPTSSSGTNNPINTLVTSSSNSADPGAVQSGNCLAICHVDEGESNKPSESSTDNNGASSGNLENMSQPADTENGASDGQGNNTGAIDPSPSDTQTSPLSAVVGGEILGIDMTSLFLAGFFGNSVWIFSISGAAVALITGLVLKKLKPA